MRNKFLSVILGTAIVFSSTTSIFAASDVNFLKTNDKFGTPEFVTGNLTAPSDKSEEDIIYGYINSNIKNLKIAASAEESFTVKSKFKDTDGHRVVQIQQVYKGIPVFGFTQKAVIGKDGVLKSLSGAAVPALDQKDSLKQAIKLKPEEALKIAESDLGFKPQYEDIKPTSNLVIFNDSYTFLVNLNFLYPEPGNWSYFVDAVTGNVVNKFNKIENVTGTNATSTGKGVLGDTKTFNTTLSSGSYYLQDNTRGSGIFTYNAKNSSALPGTLWSNTTGSFTTSTDAALVDAHYYAAKTFDYYKNTFGRNSYNNAGAALKSTVHYGNKYNNAFWNGSQMVYGDGDGVTFLPFSGALDVVAHELTHAVTDSEAGLIYQNEPGAISEALSDIFGTLAEYYDNRSPDWEEGEDIYTPGVSGDALRSLQNPKKYGDPDRYADRYKGTSDNGGVHTNSGIINKVGYLIANGGTHYGVTVSGIGNDKLGKIFYRAIVYYVTANETFSNLRAHAVKAATDLYGASSAEVNTVKNAFDSVGVL